MSVNNPNTILNSPVVDILGVPLGEFTPKHDVQQSHAVSPELAKLANHGSPVPKRNVALVSAIEKIESIKYHAPDFKDAKELKAAFEEADKEVKTKGAAAIDGQADVIVALAKMQAILSQRGKEKMRREAGIGLNQGGSNGVHRNPVFDEC